MYKKTAIILCLFSMIFAQDNVELEENRHFNSYQINLDRFKQLNEDITTPNTYRTAAGYPGHEYWQVRADYDMKLRIDDNKQRLYGEETVTFQIPTKFNLLVTFQLKEEMRRWLLVVQFHREH